MKFLIVAAAFLSSTAFAQWNPQFHTRIHNKLAISGRLCEGGERTFGVESEICKKGQWMVNVDNINTCSDEGWCTEMAAPSFIAELERANIFIPHTGDYYDIIPVSKVSGDVNMILKKYWLHDHEDKSEVVKKKL